MKTINISISGEGAFFHKLIDLTREGKIEWRGMVGTIGNWKFLAYQAVDSFANKYFYIRDTIEDQTILCLFLARDDIDKNEHKHFLELIHLANEVSIENERNYINEKIRELRKDFYLKS